MKLLKPHWVNNEGNPVYSIDIHPDGSRFATGGMCSDSGRVCVWNMSPVTNEAHEKNESIPKMLCRMDNHLACVNSVRWSKSGRYLASGGDDRIIMIWQHSGTGGSSFGGPTNVEQWRSTATLRGHGMEVLDVAWSPDDSMLATASPDNTVLIWNTEKWSEILATLRGHTGLVKGVIWDPIGRYLASQSDDKSLRVWRTSDWKEEVKITEPFTECGGTTHVLRLGWSPDGQFLVSAHAMNNLGSTAQIIERDGWNTDKDFVGHRKAVTCVRFNDKIFNKPVLKERKMRNGQKAEVNGHSTDYTPKKMQKCVCLAMGSRDRSLSVWVTHLKRPLVVIHDMFKNTIVDLAWSSDGLTLMACSVDGTVAYLQFEAGELGQTLSKEEKAMYYEKLYGKSALVDPRKRVQPSPVVELIEDPELLKAQEEMKESIQKTKPSNGSAILVSDSRSQMSTGSLSRSPTSKNPTDRQIETKMPDGRRRITPLFIPPTGGSEGAPKPYVSNEENIMSSSSAAKSKIVVEHVSASNDQDQIMVTPQNDKSAAEANPKSSEPEQPKPSYTNNVPPSTKTHEDFMRARTELRKELEQSGSKRKADSFQLPSAKKKPGRTPISVPPPKTTNPPPLPDPRPVDEISTLLLPSLSIDKITSVTLSGSNPLLNVTVENEVGGSPLNVLRLTRQTTKEGGENLQWRTILGSKIRSISGSNDLIVCTCDDWTLNLFVTETGARFSPPLMIDSHAAKVLVSGWRVLLVTSYGKLWMWDFQLPADRRVIVRSEPLNILFRQSKDSYITSCTITNTGWPVLNFSSGKSFLYDNSCATWTLLTDEGDPLSGMFSSKYFNQIIAGSEKKVMDSLSSFKSLHWKSANYSENRALKNAISSSSGLWRESAISYCDRQIASCVKLNSAAEYRYWTLQLVRHLVESNSEHRLRIMCQSLVKRTANFRRRPSSKVPIESGEDLIDDCKQEVLREILLCISKNVSLQRLYSEFKDMAQFVSEKTPTSINPSPQLLSPPRQGQTPLELNESSSSSIQPVNATLNSNHGTPMTNGREAPMDVGPSPILTPLSDPIKTEKVEEDEGEQQLQLSNSPKMNGDAANESVPA